MALQVQRQHADHHAQSAPKRTFSTAPAPVPFFLSLSQSLKRGHREGARKEGAMGRRRTGSVPVPERVICESFSFGSDLETETQKFSYASLSLVQARGRISSSGSGLCGCDGAGNLLILCTPWDCCVRATDSSTM
eukprot:344787-Rhodomonas_salina.2